MRVVVQRVSSAYVDIDSLRHEQIGSGFLLLLGIESSDTTEDIQWLVRKLLTLRIFSDPEDKMNLSITDVTGQILVVSQFTLHASIKKGTRPSFIKAATPEIAIPLYQLFLSELQHQSGLVVKAGIFAAKMQVGLVNDGPVTIIIDSKHKE